MRFKAKWQRDFSAGIALVIIGSLVACGQSDANSTSKETKTVRVAYYPNPTHPIITAGLDPYLEEIEKKSDGQLKFEVYPSEQLGKAVDAITTVTSGTADITFMALPYHDKELPMSQAALLPWGWGSWEATNTFWRALHEPGVIKNEWQDKGLVPLWGVSNPPYEIASSNKPVPTLASLKGMKVRSFSDIGDELLRSVGAVPVQIETPEMYQSLQQGVIDASVYAFSSWGQYSLNEVVNYATVNTKFAVVPGLLFFTTKEFMDSLSTDLQEIVMKAGMTAMDNAQTANLTVNDEALKKFIKNGLKTTEWSDKDLASLQKQFDAVKQQWISEAVKAGYPAEDAEAQIAKLRKEAAKAPEDVPYYPY